MIKAVVFDCFGVLVEDALKAMREELESRERHQITDILHTSHRGEISREDALRQVAAILGITEEILYARLSEGEVINRQLLEYAGALKNRYKTAILSNISQGGLKRWFSDDQLEQNFDVAVSSGDIGFAKPEARAYEIVADRLGVLLNECVFIDDNEAFCNGAKAVGMTAIQYESFGQLKNELQELLSKTGAE